MHSLVDFKTRPMTEDGVLNVLREMHRQWSAEDGDPDAVIGSETTVNEWCMACGFDPWVNGFDPVAGWNEFFHVSFTADEWSQVVKPGRTRTLREVSTLIASRAQVEEIEPISWFGRPCLPAGIFLAIRTFVARAGAHVQNLKPSTPLNRYFDGRAYPRFFCDLMRIAPGRLPVLHFIGPQYEGWLVRVFLVCLVVAFISSILAKIADIAALVLVMAIVIGIVAIVAFYISNKRPALRVECGSLHDFGDLARAVAGEANTPNHRPGAGG